MCGPLFVGVLLRRIGASFETYVMHTRDPSILATDRFEANIWSVRAWSLHAYACDGFEEGCVSELLDAMLPDNILPMLSDASQGMPSLGPVPSSLKAQSPVCPTNRSPVFVVFSQAAVKKSC